MKEELLFCLECLATVEVAGVYILEIRKPLDFGVQASTGAAGEECLLIALIAEEMLAGV